MTRAAFCVLCVLMLSITLRASRFKHHAPLITQPSNLLIDAAICYKPCFAVTPFFASIVAGSASGLSSNGPREI